MPKKAEKFPGPLEHRFANDWARETPSEKQKENAGLTKNGA